MAEIKNTADITNTLNAYQNGQTVDSNGESEIVNGFVGAPSLDVYGMMKTGIGPDYVSDYRNKTLEAALSGWGSSRFDRKFGYQSDRDLEDLRANAQPWIGKITNGLMKMGATTLSTAANTTVGTVAGLLGATVEAGKEIVNDDGAVNLNGRDILSAGINNPVSDFLVNNFRNYTEELFPNYQTEEERTDEYQKQFLRPDHFFSGNFIGDSLLKNFGFTLGAMGGGMVWNKLIGKVAASKLSSDLMKGAVAAAEGNPEAAAIIKDAADIVQKTRSVNGVDWTKITEVLPEAGKKLNRARTSFQLFGATTAAIGEGNAEGLMARDEFMEEFMPRMQMEFAEAYNSLEQNLYNEHPEWFVTEDINGNPLPQPILVDEAGVAELQNRQIKLADEYKKTQEYAEKQADVLANTTFLLNLPILMASDLIQFGRMFGGDWSTARQNTPKLKGKLGELRSATVGEQALLGSAKVAASEASEEMLQGFVSSGAKNVAENRLTYFKDLGYDEDATNKAASGMSLLLQGGIDYLGDSKNWQEGVIGALTGLMGIPGKQWHGGVVEEVKRAKAEKIVSDAAAKKLNELVKNPEFKQRWENYVRHMSYDDKMNQAVQNNDQYAWHIADSEQLVSDVLAFADAGRIEDLNDFVDSVADIKNNPETIKDIKQNILGVDDKVPDSEIVNKVTAQADHMKKVIDSYYKTLTQLKDVAPEDIGTDRFKEMLFTGMQLNEFENLFFDNLDKTIKTLQPFFAVRAAMREDGTPESDSGKIQMQLEALRNEYAKAISSTQPNSSVLDIVPGKTITKILDDTEAEFNKISDSSTSATKDQREAMSESLKTMRRLATERRELVNKFRTLRNMSNEKFDEQAINSDKKLKKAESSQTKIDLSNIGSVEDVKVEIAKRVGKEKKNYIDSLKSSRKDNLAVDEYFKIQELNNEINTQSRKALNNPSVPVREKDFANFIFEKMFEKASSVQQILDMDPTILPTKEEVIATQGDTVTFNNVDSRAMDSLYNNAIEDVRDIINDVRKDRELSQIFDISPATNSEKSSAVLSALGVPAEESKPQSSTNDRRSQAEQQVRSQLLGQQQAEKSAQKEREKQVEADFAFAAPINPDTPNPSSEAKPAAQDNPDANSYSDEPKLLDDSTPVEPDIITPSPVSIHPAEDTEDIQVDVVNSNVPQNVTKDTEDPDKSSTEEGQRDNYNMSVPEKSPEATRLRIAAAKEDYGIIATEYTDLPDEVNERDENTGSRFKKIWDILREKFNAFNNADKVRVGDKVHFFIDPTLEQYDGEPQILMGVKRGDKVFIYNILRKNADWRGLKELRNEIISEYGKWEQKDGQQFFEFSKASRVWARQPGFIQYDMSPNPASDSSINTKTGFDNTAPIITIDSDGNYIQLSGKKLSGEVENYLPAGFKENITRQGRRRGQSRIIGNLYYLARGKDEQYIPIRLNVEHFRPESVNATGYGYDTIHRVSDSLARLTSKYTKDVNDAISSINSKTFNTPEERKKALAKAIDAVTNATNKEKIRLINELNKVLDVHGLTVTYGIRKGSQGEYVPTVWFRTYSDTIDDNGNYSRGDILEKTKAEFIDGVTGDTVVDYLASLGRSFNVSFPDETQKSKSEVSNHISSMAESGLLTSNARTMRAEGVDIYIDSFNPETRQFDNYHKSKRSSDIVAEQSVANPVPETSAITEISASNTEAVTTAPVSVQDIKNGDFSSLDEEVQRKLIDLGITSDVFNAMSEIQKESLLHCYG